jgi:hypothetical protein
MTMPLRIVALLPLALLCACGHDRSPTTTAAPAASATAATANAVTHNDAGTVTDTQHGFALAVPAGMALRHDFQRSYLGDGAWKAFAGPDSHGEPAAALVLDGSNGITAAELRLGIGTDAEALAHCRELPASATSGSDTVVLAGVPFIHFHAGDAAMSHYLEVESYRAVHAGRCYAIDLLLTGTRPEVYDPPASPPFDHDTAWQKLHGALGGFRLLP